jgi:predicted DNA-binding ribbon-helix-helix protein
VINAERVTGNLSSAVRLFVLDHFRLKIGSTIGAPSIPLAEAVARDSKVQDKGR